MCLTPWLPVLVGVYSVNFRKSQKLPCLSRSERTAHTPNTNTEYSQPARSKQANFFKCTDAGEACDHPARAGGGF